MLGAEAAQTEQDGKHMVLGRGALPGDARTGRPMTCGCTTWDTAAPASLQCRTSDPRALQGSAC